MSKSDMTGEHQLMEITGLSWISDRVQKTNCPVCAYTELEEYDFCPRCGWCIDHVQELNPDMEGGANHMSLNEARRAWEEGNKID